MHYLSGSPSAGRKCRIHSCYTFCWLIISQISANWADVTDVVCAEWSFASILYSDLHCGKIFIIKIGLNLIRLMDNASSTTWFFRTICICIFNEKKILPSSRRLCVFRGDPRAEAATRRFQSLPKPAQQLLFRSHRETSRGFYNRCISRFCPVRTAAYR